MLKFIYTETALHLELASIDLSTWVDRRRIFAASIGESLSISAERATLLLPNPICGIEAIDFYLHHQGAQGVTVHSCDLDHIEITFTGYWLSARLDIAEGIFITQLPDRVESYLWQLWYEANCRLVPEDGVMG